MNDKIRRAIFDEVGEDGINEEIESLGEYNRRESVIEFRNLNTMTPQVLRVLAGFAEDLGMAMGEEFTISLSGIYRAKDRRGLIDAAYDAIYWRRRDYWQERAGEPIS